MHLILKWAQENSFDIRILLLSSFKFIKCINFVKGAQHSYIFESVRSQINLLSLSGFFFF